MSDCKRDCKYYNVDQGEYPCNECKRLISHKDHYKRLEENEKV